MEVDQRTGKKVSKYLEYLPGILRQDPFLGQFLLAFERILSGLQISDDKPDLEPGLEQHIDRIHHYFNPNPEKDSLKEANKNFLPWLAGWVGLSLRDDWDEATKREFIAGMVPLYRQRGTRAGLKKILGLYLKSLGFSEIVEVFEFEQRPYYFQVQLDLGVMSPAYWRQVRIAKDIIDREKPAHTYYGLKIRVPTMRIPDPSSDEKLKIFAGVDEKGEPYDGNTALGTLKGTTI